MMRYALIAILALLALLIIAPPLLGTGWQYALINALIAALFAAAFNLLVGQGGMLSFGHAAYFGVGAFTVIHLMQSVEYGDFPFPTVLLPLAGAAVSLLCGVLAGFFATMRSGVYFALVTLALAELLHSLAPHWDEMFGGEAGLSSMRMPSLGLTFGSTLEVYYLTLAWVVICIGLLYAYTRTPFGRLTLALRDNEQRIRFMGFNAHGTKILVFGISAMFSGVAGSLMAISNETANYSVFSTQVSALVVLHTFVGGSTIFFGPIVGACVLSLFTFVVSGVTHSWMLYQGIIFVLVMLFAPKGIGGVIQAHIEQRHSLPWKRLAAPYALATLAGLMVACATVFVVQSLEIVLSREYAAAVARTGEYAPYTVFGLEWRVFHPLTWLFPLLLLVPGLYMLRRAFARIQTLWDNDESDDDGDIATTPELMEGGR
ncbi:branched-chain amino acid ABC transporter permease [Alloalcanivorax marinus]|uniref:branched-chain amino acid ABC transporter permease n=1 Tax=Alloalcanivorax marinus TaxID=1177169 RepID=UPI001EE3DC17|nr:branched-chain amino acid ABC transporter permease [Alloalcanivorax marinus]